MSTIFDFFAVAIFIAIVGMFFKFSKKEEQNISAYIWPAMGCALGNYFGNGGFEILAWIIFFFTIYYVSFHILKGEGVPDDTEGRE